MTVAARAGSSPRWAVPSPVRQLVPVALFVAVATATVVIVDERPDIARAGDSAAALAGELAAGALLVAAALAAQAWRPRLRFTGPLAATGSGALDRRLCDESGDARAGRRRGLRPTRAGMP